MSHKDPKNHFEETETTFVAIHPSDDRHHEEGGHGGGEHGGTEMGWLVSYADMMTLLFGLFVVLFSLASDKTKNVDDVMKEVSKKFYTTQNGEEPHPAAQSPIEEPKGSPVASVETPDLSAELKKEVEAKAEVIEQVKTLEQEKSEIIAQVQALELQVTELEKKNGEIKNEKVKISRKVANIAEETDLKNEELEKIKQEVQAKANEISQLKEEIKKNNEKPISQSYMMVLASWETPKHDIDLFIKSPDGKIYSFKKKTFPGFPGLFDLDSRFGPGIEMWRAENFKAGDYTAEIRMYNQNANLEPAKTQLTIVTNLKTYRSEFKPLISNNQKAIISFKVSEEGTVEFF